MMNPHIKNEKTAVPWWAAFGAPLLGVPLLVGLLALSAPAEPAPAAVQENEAPAFVADETEDERPATAGVTARLEFGGDSVSRC